MAQRHCRSGRRSPASPHGRGQRRCSRPAAPQTPARRPRRRLPAPSAPGHASVHAQTRCRERGRCGHGPASRRAQPHWEAVAREGGQIIAGGGGSDAALPAPQGTPGDSSASAGSCERPQCSWVPSCLTAIFRQRHRLDLQEAAGALPCWQQPWCQPLLCCCCCCCCCSCCCCCLCCRGRCWALDAAPLDACFSCRAGAARPSRAQHKVDAALAVCAVPHFCLHPIVRRQPRQQAGLQQAAHHGVGLCRVGADPAALQQ